MKIKKQLRLLECGHTMIIYREWKKMKKNLLMYIAVTMVLPLFACKNSNDSQTKEATSNIEETSSVIEQLPQEEFLITGLDNIPQKEKVQTPSDGINLENTVSSFSNTYISISL